MVRALKMARETEGVRHATFIAGQSFALSANGSNFGSMFVNLQPYDERRDPNVVRMPARVHPRKRLRRRVATKDPRAT